jgi:hypothetical protein
MSENEQKAMSPEEARTIIGLERQARAQLCQQALNETLQKHRCAIQSAITVTQDGRLVATPQIVPLD